MNSFRDLRQEWRCNRWIAASLAAAVLGLSACGGGGGGGDEEPAGPTAAQKSAVVTQYANMGYAVYSDALADAEALQTAVEAFLSAPSADGLNTVKAAWKNSRETYQQSEVYRFDEGFVTGSPESDGGLASVDAWEGELNAWPLDEALIDYVDGTYSGGAPDEGANIISSTSLRVNGVDVDTSTIDKDLLASLNGIGGSEANVTTGYHAIEFLLWGQDLSQAQATAGQRPFTDFVLGDGCTHGNCDRRQAYLRAATDLLVDDLTAMAAEWNPASSGKTLRTSLLAQSADVALQRMFYGMGSLALGELASERMRVALIADSPEDEHDCFSDTSHNSYFYDGRGVANVYRGSYLRRNGTTVSGGSLSSLIAIASSADDSAAQATLATALQRLQALKDSGDAGDTFDYLIDGNDPTEIIQGAIDALIEFTDDLEAGADALGISVDSDCGSTLCG